MKKYIPLISITCFVLLALGLLIVYGCGQVSKAPEGFSSEGSYVLSGSNIQTRGTNTGGTITGKVIRSFTGTAIQGALIFAPSATGGTVSTCTNSSGNYTLSGAQIGKIPVTVAKQNYIAMTIVCSSSKINFALYSSWEAPSLPGIGTIEADIRYGGTRIEGWVSGYSESEPFCSHGSRVSLPDYPDIDLPAGTVHLSAHAVGIGGTSQETILNLSEDETKLITLEISSLVGTVEGTVTPPSGLPDLHIAATSISPGTHILPFGRASIEGTNYTMQVPPSQGNPYFMLVQASSQEGGWHVPVSLIYDWLSISDGQIITRNYSFKNVPILTSPSGSIPTSTPTFIWTASGSPTLYVAVSGINLGSAKWLGFTDETSIQYPDFPSGSEWEITSGPTYCWTAQAYYRSGIDLSNIDFIDLIEGGLEGSIAQGNTFTKSP